MLHTQTLTGGDYALVDHRTFEPHPDFYIALLWARLMGTAALAVTANATVTATATSSTHTNTAPVLDSAITRVAVSTTAVVLYVIQIRYRVHGNGQNTQN